MARIFISHSSRDNEPAARIKAWLNEQGFETPFLDFDKHAGIPPGADWEKTLYREIEWSEAMIIIQTPNWLESKWCFAEFTQARALGKSIFPIIETPSNDTLILPDIQSLDLLKDREGGLERLSGQLTQIALDAQGGFEWDASRPPYPGLLSFQEEDAALHFGRDDDIRRLIERLNARRAQGGTKLIALLGASGSGKSSLLRAGVIPRLKRSGRNWVVLPPMRPQARPVDELARCLAVACGQDMDWRKLREELNGDNLELTLSDIANDLRVKAAANEAQILLSIDQAEELFGAADRDQAQRFFEILNVAMTSDLPFIAVLALRSDFLGSLQSAEFLTARFEEFSLGPMPLARIAQIIEGPARVAGLGIDEAFVHQAARDAETEDALPLLAFALRELYDGASNDNYLSLDEYRALGDEAGGLTPLENAVRKSADNVLAEASPDAEELMALQEAFVPAMVRVNEQGEYVRRPARWDDLPGKSHSLLEHLAEARLLIVSQDGDERMVEVSHEALLRKWPRLRAWLDDAREFLAGRQQMEVELHDWEQANDADKTGALLTGLKLNRAREWLAERSHQLSEKERELIQASIDHADTTERRKVRLRRNITAVSIAAAVLFAGLAVFAGFASIDARDSYKEALANNLAFISNRLLVDGDFSRAIRIAEESYEVQSKYISPSVEQTMTNSYAHVLLTKKGLYQHIFRHRLIVTHAAISPDGSIVATASKDGKVRLWDMQGNLKQTMSQGAGVIHVAFLHDGSGIMTVGDGHLIKRWDLDGNLEQDFVGHGCEPKYNFCNVNEVAISPDDATLVTVAADQQVIVWNRDGTKRRAFDHSRGNGGINYVSFSPRGQYFATSGTDWDWTVQLYDVGGQHIASLGSDSCSEEKHWNCAVSKVVFSPADESLWMAAFPDRSVRVYDVQGNLKDTFNGHQGRVNSVAYHPDGKLFVTASSDNTAILWTASGDKKYLLEGHAGPVTMATFSPDGKYIATSSEDKTTKLWDLEGNLLTSYEGHGSGIGFVVFSPDSQFLVTASKDKSARLWKVKPIKIPILRPGFQIAAASFLLDGKRVLTVGTDTDPMVAQLWGPTERGNEFLQLLKTYEGFGADNYGNRRIFSLEVSPDGNRFITTGTDYTVRIWDLENERVIGEWKDSEGCADNDWCGPVNARYSADNQYIITGDLGGNVKIYDAEGALLKTIRAHDQEVRGVDISRDNKYLVTGSHDKTIKLWDFNTRELIETFSGHLGPVCCVKFSQDGMTILSGSHDGTIKLWDRGGKVKFKAEHASAVSSVEFSPDMNQILSSSHDGTAKVWDIELNIIRTLKAHEKQINTARFAPQGERIITASHDGTARIWLSPNEMYNWIEKNNDSIYRLTCDDRKELRIPGGDCD